MSKPTEVAGEDALPDAGRASTAGADSSASHPGPTPDGAAAPAATAASSAAEGTSPDAAPSTSGSAASPPAPSEASERICLICREPLLPEAFESGEALVLDCGCRGDMALRHRDCAIKLTHHQGHTNCDVCKKPIANLPPIPDEVLAKRRREQAREAAEALMGLLRQAVDDEELRRGRQECLKFLIRLLGLGFFVTIFVLSRFPAVVDKLDAGGGLAFVAVVFAGSVAFVVLVSCLLLMLACCCLMSARRRRGEGGEREPLLGAERV